MQRVSRMIVSSLAWLPIAASSAAERELPFERTETREDCAHYTPERRPLFGDLHVHTRYSFDSYTSGQRNDPWDAYRYAKGEPIQLPDVDGGQSVRAQIRRPLDFVSVTDHGEYLGEIELCTNDPWSVGYWMPLCMLTRSDFFYLQLIAASQWVSVGTTKVSKDAPRSYVCDLPGGSCAESLDVAWANLQRAAEEHYDRTAACQLTTFVGYEYTDAPNFKNLHRNVIFRNERVVNRPVTTYETGPRNFPDL